MDVVVRVFEENLDHFHRVAGIARTFRRFSLRPGSVRWRVPARIPDNSADVEGADRRWITILANGDLVGLDDLVATFDRQHPRAEIGVEGNRREVGGGVPTRGRRG